METNGKMGEQINKLQNDRDTAKQRRATEREREREIDEV